MTATPRTHDSATGRDASLAVLRRAGQPMSVAEVASAQGRHVNTVRAHLDLLVDTGYAKRFVEHRATPGRPRVLYEATGRPVADDTTASVAANYRILAQVLVQQIASRATAAEYQEIGRNAGRTWASATQEILPVDPVRDEAEAYAQATDLMTDLGFEPTSDPGRHRIVLHACPYLGGPADHLPIVCGVHHGLLEGTLERMDAPIVPRRLDVHVNPIRCVVHMTHRDASS